MKKENYTGLLVAAAIGVLLGVIRPAMAGNWTVTYQASGHYTDSHGTRAWPSAPDPCRDCDGYIELDDDDFDGTSGVTNSGTVTPVYHWNRSGDDDNPPATIHALISVRASSLPGSDLWDQLADSFKDPQIHDPFTMSVYMNGDHPDSLSDATGTDTVVGHPVTVRANIPNGYGGMTSIGFRAAVIDIDVGGTSTDGASGAPPPFFSGTNCNAFGYANLPGPAEPFVYPQGFSYAALVIGGTVVKEESYSDPQNHRFVGFNCDFDSTHFGDTSPITIAFRARDDCGKTYEVTRQASAYNKALALGLDNSWRGFGYPAWPGQRGAAISASAFASMNHTVTHSTSFSKDQVLQSTKGNTAFYIATHGDEAKFMAPYFPFPPRDYQMWITDGDIWDEILKKRVNGVSVFPEYNLVVLDACATLEKDDSQGNRIPGEIDESMPFSFLMAGATDRAFVGFDDETNATGIPIWTQQLFNRLKAGDAVLEATIYAGQFTYSWTDIAVAIPATVLYDPRTKIHGLYNAKGLLWLRTAPAW